MLKALSQCSQCVDYKESERKEFFNKNFEVFAKLEKTQREDMRLVGHVSINRDYGNLSEARLGEYRKLMKQAGLEYFGHFIDEPEKRIVRFYEDIEIVDSGYVYMEYPPPKFFNNLSECKPIKPTESCYILLKENWYWFSERYRLKQ